MTSNLMTTYLKLGREADAQLLPVDEQFWAKLSQGQLGDFHNEFLVSAFSFEHDWDMWEMHPNGDEIVMLLSGAVRFIFGDEEKVLDQPLSFVKVPKGTWYTAKVIQPAQMIFMTAGEGTQHRPIEASE